MKTIIFSSYMNGELMWKKEVEMDDEALARMNDKFKMLDKIKADAIAKMEKHMEDNKEILEEGRKIMKETGRNVRITKDKKIIVL